MKPSDSKERVRERVQRHRAVTPPDNVTPHVTPPYADIEDGHRCPGVPVTPQNDTTGGTIDAIPRRSMGKTPEESGYPAGQVDVRTGPQGQKLWRLNGCYRMDNRILCMKA